MRDVDWGTPAPCFAFVGAGSCYCLDCLASMDAELREAWAWPYRATTLAWAAAAVLVGWALDVEDLAREAEVPPEAARFDMLRGRAAAELAWLGEHLDIDAAEATALAELMATFELARNDGQHLLALRDAWRALQLAAGHA